MNTRISVIIPVFNDPDGIDNTLGSVLSQTYDRYEIIPVDNNSTDDTPHVINKWESHSSIVRPTTERRIQSSYAARNTGIKNAEGEIIVFLDADMTVPRQWLHQIDSEFSTSDVDYLGYEIELYLPNGQPGIWGYYDKIAGLPSRYYYEEKQFAPTSSLAVRQSVFDRIGLFNERLTSGGDKEFGQRVSNNPDLKMGFSDEIIVYHPARTSFQSHVQKSLRVGRGLGELARESGWAFRPGTPLFELATYALPPNPLRIYRRDDGLRFHNYIGVYIANLIVRYIRIFGALSYVVNDSSEIER